MHPSMKTAKNIFLITTICIFAAMLLIFGIGTYNARKSDLDFIADMKSSLTEFKKTAEFNKLNELLNNDRLDITKDKEMELIDIKSTLKKNKKIDIKKYNAILKSDKYTAASIKKYNRLFSSIGDIFSYILNHKFAVLFNDMKKNILELSKSKNEFIRIKLNENEVRSYYVHYDDDKMELDVTQYYFPMEKFELDIDDIMIYLIYCIAYQ